jgi:cyclopropane fatty-acyl-phospholipid synthase-like methyltransferase
MACGRGRHVRRFAEAGMRVTGIDLSEESVKEARKDVPDADLRVHDMREPVARERFRPRSMPVHEPRLFDRSRG